MLIQEQSDLDEHLAIHTDGISTSLTFHLDDINRIYLRVGDTLSQKIICCPYCMMPFSIKKPRENLRQEIINKINSYNLDTIDGSAECYEKLQNCKAPNRLLYLTVQYYIAQEEDIQCLA